MRSRRPVPVRPSVAARLRAETREAHADLETALGFLDEHVDAARYLALIRRWYGFHAVLEPRLDRWHEQSPVLDWPPRRKLPLLRADLATLGVRGSAVREIPHCPVVPDVASSSQALGTLYVVEGATLGGAVLDRRLARSGIPADARQFLSSYRADVGPAWQRFGAATAGWVAGDAAREDAVVAAALETFAALRCWLPAAAPS